VVHIVADVRRMPLPSNSEDCIAAIFMLYHLEDIREAFREFRRVLKSGGVLLTTYQPTFPPVFLEEETGDIIVSKTCGTWRVARTSIDASTALKVIKVFFDIDEVCTHKEKTGYDWLLIKAINRGS